MTIVDAHVHLIDPTRPQGVPRPEPESALYKPTLPEHLRAVAEPHGVGGAVAIEWSDWLEDNRWLLGLADADPFVMGVVGNLAAGTAGFAERLDRFRRHPRFVGIRVGTPWCPLDTRNPQLIDDLRALAASGLVLDAVTVGGGTIDLLETVIALTDRISGLRVVVDHLPFEIPFAERARYVTMLRELGTRPNVWAKLSNPVPRTGHVPMDRDAYRQRFADEWASFGSGRLMYGSNWPVSTRFASYDRGFAILREFVDDHGPEDADRFFGRTAVEAYQLPEGAPVAG